MLRRERRAFPPLICYGLNTVCSLTSFVKASSANRVRLSRSATCSSIGVAGSPKGYGIEMVGTIRFAPTDNDTGTILHM